MPSILQNIWRQEEIVPLRVSSLRMALWLQIQRAVKQQKILSEDQLADLDRE
jgi:hypothetical protein